MANFRHRLTDSTVYPNSRIARLPKFLRPAALIARNIAPDTWRRYRYTYRSIDVGTSNYSPFLHDAAFNRIYDRVAGHWLEGDADIRWKLWILSRLARHRRGAPAESPGNFAEFGVFRGGCAFTVLSTASLPHSQLYFLFDTFDGTPESRLSEQERRFGLSGEWTDTSVREVTDLLAPWSEQIEICKGDVLETLQTAETGDLSFVHIDLNATAPTLVALEYAYPRLTPGAIVVFDDYGSSRYDEQRLGIDEFFAGRPEDVVALPTGQALAIKR
jgi:hypothetical protein